MKVGLIGYPMAGKSTLYAAVARGVGKASVAAVPVPDPRFDRIVAQVQPKKVTPATVILHDDLEDIGSTSGKVFSQEFLKNARDVELLLHVVRAFENDAAPYHASVNPKRDLDTVEVEMVLADLQIVETRLERLAKSLQARQPGSPEYLEQRLFERVKGPLEEGTPLRALEFDDEEQKIVRNFQFLSAKPCVVAFNVGEADAGSPPATISALIDELAARQTPAFSVSATLEAEIAELDAADQKEFLESAGISEPAAAKVIRAVYDGLGLITFFTAGENETKAWPLRRGSSAHKAAGTIHTDIAKGFIRAEIVHYADYDAAGSLDAAYKGGKMHLEGKDYVIQDGDLLHIRNKS